MSFDYSKLLGKIVEVYGTQQKFSDAMNLSERSISLKLNGKTGWKQSEIVQASNLLGIPAELISQYFFAQKVQLD